MWLIGPSGFHRNSPQGLNISSIRVFGQIRYPEIPITLRPHIYVFTECKKLAFKELGGSLQSLYIMSSAHSPTFPSLHLRHNSFSNPSVALPTSQLILQHFRCFTYVTVHSPILLLLLLRHKLFT